MDFNQLQNPKSNFCKIQIGIEEEEKIKFIYYLKKYLNVILEYIYSSNNSQEIISNADSFEKLFYDILELIIIKNISYECESQKFSYFVFNKLIFLVLISLKYKENENFQYNFIVTLRLFMFYNTNKIELEVVNIEIQYKISENTKMKLIEEKHLLDSFKEIKKIYKEINVKSFLKYDRKLKFVALIHKNEITEFNKLIKTILLEKGIETFGDKFYSNGLFRIEKFKENFIKCINCNGDHIEAVKIFFIEKFHKCKFYLCLDCFSLKRNMKILNDDCFTCENYFINFFLMKFIEE